jgi:hypothetical protein
MNPSATNKQPQHGPPWFFWPIAFTFIWAFFIAPIGLKKLLGWNEWITVYGYPVMCGISAIYLLRAKKNGGIAFAFLNLAFAIAWIAFVIGAFRAFAHSFWK